MGGCLLLQVTRPLASDFGYAWLYTASLLCYVHLG
jgi:hypothetical protein